MLVMAQSVLDVGLGHREGLPHRRCLPSTGTINKVMVAALDGTQSCSMTAGAARVGFQSSSTWILEFGAEASCDYLSGPRTLCPHMLLHCKLPPPEKLHPLQEDSRPH